MAKEPDIDHLLEADAAAGIFTALVTMEDGLDVKLWRQIDQTRLKQSKQIALKIMHYHLGKHHDFLFPQKDSEDE